MNTLRILQIIKILLAVTVVVIFAAIGMRETIPVGADQQTEEQDRKMEWRRGCIFSDKSRARLPCYRAFCKKEGTECSAWGGACFSADENDEDGFCDY